MKGRLRLGCAVAAAMALLAMAGCSQPQSSDAGQGDLALEDLAIRVAEMEQQMAMLEAQLGGQPAAPTNAEPAGEAAAGEGAAGEVAAVDGAQSTGRARVSTPFLRVRQEPSTDALQIGTLKENARVEILARQGDWANIQFSNEKTGVELNGWVAAQYLKDE